MTSLKEVPTEELLSFQDFTPVHSPTTASSSSPLAQINVNLLDRSSEGFDGSNDDPDPLADGEEAPRSPKSIWSFAFYQRYFDVDTDEVVERLISSFIPRQQKNNRIKLKPDLYGPFWVATTLIFTIAISGNISSYLQNVNIHYHWRYNFHLVSYAATAIVFYTTVVPLSVWGLLRWSSEVNNLDGIEDDIETGPLEIMCIYGYSLFIYIPVSILWTIQLGWLQWSLVLLAAFLSGSVLVRMLLPSFRLSKYKLFMIVGVMVCHFLLAVGFMEYFFHVPEDFPVVHTTVSNVNATSKQM